MIFYASECNTETSFYTLSESESKHCIKVLRNTIGNTIEIINGKGLQLHCKIIDDHHKRCKVEVVSRKSHPDNKQKIHIAMAIPKSSERLEWFMEKATEIGINRLSLLNCKHSEKRSFNHKRLEKITIAALKQCKRYHIPKIDSVISYQEFIETYPTGYIGHCSPNQKISAKEMNQANPFLIGPEGDFSDEEIKKAIESGYVAVDLSANRLRTETAALSAVFYLSNLV
tara:strand:+ start:257 stop:940 length:684 start_codon:yes stop_codon:yes gene_type:complete